MTRLTADDVVAAALAVVAGDGLDDLTIRAVAKRLGCAPMTIYRHVADRDELVARTVDRAAAEIDLAPFDGAVTSWLVAMAHEVRRVLLRYPGSAEYLTDHGPAGPHAMALMDRVCEVLGELGLDPPDEAIAYDVLMTVVAVSTAKQLRAAARGVDGLQAGSAFAAKAAEYAAKLPHLRRVAPEFTRDFDEAFDRKVRAIVTAIVARTADGPAGDVRR